LLSIFFTISRSYIERHANMSAIAYTVKTMWQQLAEYLSNFVHLFKFWCVVHPYEQGVLMRLGTHTDVLESGFHWVCPLGVHEVLLDHVQPRPLTVNVSAHTRDGVQVEASLVIVWEVVDVATFLLEHDHEHAPAAAGAAALGRHLRAEHWETLGTDEASERLLVASTEAFEQLGLAVVSADLADLTRIRTIRVRGLSARP
jgi:hypothetical protein